MENQTETTNMTVGQAAAETLFSSLPMSEEACVRADQVRSAFKAVGARVLDLLPEGRYKSMVITKLEEAQMLSTKSLSHR